MICVTVKAIVCPHSHPHKNSWFRTNMGGHQRTYKVSKRSVYSILSSSYGILRTRTNKTTADLWSATLFNDLARFRAAASIGQYPHSTHNWGNSVLFGPTPPSRKTPGVAACMRPRGRRGGRIRTLRPVCEATQAEGAVGGLGPMLIPPRLAKHRGSRYGAAPWPKVETASEHFHTIRSSGK